MKILFVDLSPGVGGGLISLERLFARLDRREFEPVALLAVHNPMAVRFRELTVPVYGVPTYNVDAARNTALVRQVKASSFGQRLRTGRAAALWAFARGWRTTIMRTWPLTWRLWRAMREIRPDLVHINDAIFSSRPAIAAAWLSGLPAVCHVRSLGPLNDWDRVWARTLRGFIFMSHWIARDLDAQKIPVACGRVIYDGLDTDRYAGAPDKAASRAALGLPQDRKIVLALGRLVPWKGQDLFLRAMRRVADVMPEALGLVVGETEAYSREFEPALHALAQDLHLGDAVRFLGPMADPTRVLAAADVLAHTSTSPEPFGLVMLEAMASGRPVVTPAEGGGLEIVVDGETGLLYTPRDEVALAEALLNILKDAQRATRMGEAGCARAVTTFTLHQFAEELSRFYRDLRPAAKS